MNFKTLSFIFPVGFSCVFRLQVLDKKGDGQSSEDRLTMMVSDMEEEEGKG